MLRPKVPLEKFKEYGFRPCKGIPTALYLCVSRGVSMIFVSNSIYAINRWSECGPRIHKNPNCRYLDNRTALDITYELIKADMLECYVNGM